jgi:hypothetical protein
MVPTRRVDKPCESSIRPNAMWCWSVGLLVGLLSPQNAMQGVPPVEREDKLRSGLWPYQPRCGCVILAENWKGGLSE